MKNIVLPIKSEYVRQILQGTKKYEFRKIKCKEKINYMYIYETAPVKKVVAKVKVIDIIEGTPDEVWNKCYHSAGIEKSGYDKYFLNRSKAYAFCLGECIKFESPKELSDYGINFTPQSFVYIN